MSSDLSKKGTVYLIPSIIADNTAQKVITPQIIEVVKNIEYFLVENLRTARRFISSLKVGKNIEDLKFGVLDKDTSPEEVQVLLKPVVNGTDAGIISEAGCPGIADPGALAVKYAHIYGLKVIPLVGPSSIILAIMASGFSGQSFVFHGYLPIEAKNREKSIKEIELAAIRKDQTQVFMETPYRNEKLFQDIIKYCRPETYLCIAKNITGEDEYIFTQSVAKWRSVAPDIQKSPAIFLLSQFK